MVRAWDTARGALLAELSAPGTEAPQIAVTSAGDRLAIARGIDVELIDLPGGRLERVVHGGAPVTAIAFAGETRDLAIGDADGVVRIAHDRAEPVALTKATGAIVAIAAGAGRLIAATAMRRVLVTNESHGVADLDLPYKVRAIRLTRDAKHAIALPLHTGAAVAPALVAVESCRVVARLEGHLGEVFDARFTARGEILTVGGDGTARSWDGATGASRLVFRGASRFLASGDVSFDGQLVVAGGADGLLHFWDGVTGHLVWRMKAHTSHVVGLHFEGRDIVSRSFGGDVSRWSLPDPREAIAECRGCVIVAP